MHKRTMIVRFFTLITIFISASVLSAHFLSSVQAQPTLISVTPEEGTVGTEVAIIGEIETVNGSYEVLFDNVVVLSGVASIIDVADSFHVPNSTTGVHEIKLRDVSNETESASIDFTVTPDYVVKAEALPETKQFQEGSNVTLFSVVTGEETNKTLRVRIDVVDPENVTYSTAEFLMQTSPLGNASMSRVFPVDFGNESHSSFVGDYTLKLVSSTNETLATGSFEIGLTDATEYSRFQTVNIKAANYSDFDQITAVIEFDEETVFQITPVASNGSIEVNWTIPANASLGTYSLTIDRKPIAKTPPDLQDFMIVSASYACKVRAVNTERKPVKGVLIEANNMTDNAVSENFTDADGFVSFFLEATNYTFTAFWNSSTAPRAQVGEIAQTSLSMNVTGETEHLLINCSLANLIIVARDEAGTALPLVETRINFTYVSRLEVPINESLTSQTAINGTAKFPVLITNINYTLIVGRYGSRFGEYWVNVTKATTVNVTAPTHRLTLTIYDRNQTRLAGAQVKVFESSTGQNAPEGDYVKEVTSNDFGEAEFNFTFGRYGVIVFLEGIQVNETHLDVVTQPTESSIYCSLYPLTLNITIQDYFGQGIENANVTVEREGRRVASSNTQGNGVVRFTELIGGGYRVIVIMGEETYAIKELRLQEPEAVYFRIAEVTSIGGLLIGTSAFLSILLVVVLIAVFSISFFITSSRLKSEE
ncbi:MAG: hypothetical protein JSV35_03920 [Candidatus Bathyarchaeota archaeon]|nr:MAG: hypothetical protein JSV35_03920 [Candidatus Bathyarchaeota archaeon]